MTHNIGNTIAELRKKKKWTQTELAQKLNVSDKAVSKWENDGGLPSVEFFPKLAELFGVSIDYLMTGKEELVAEEREAEQEPSFETYGAEKAVPDVGEQFKQDVDALAAEELALIVRDQGDLYRDDELRYIKYRLRELRGGQPQDLDIVSPFYDARKIKETQRAVKATRGKNDDANEAVGCFAYGVSILFPMIGMIWGTARCRYGAGKKMLIASLLSWIAGGVLVALIYGGAFIAALSALL